MTRSLRQQHSGKGDAGVVEALEGKRTIKETTSALAGCGNYFGTQGLHGPQVWDKPGLSGPSGFSGLSGLSGSLS